MSAFMVNTKLMAKVVTAILQNADQFAAIETFRGHLVDNALTDAQREAGVTMSYRRILVTA